MIQVRRHKATQQASQNAAIPFKTPMSFINDTVESEDFVIPNVMCDICPSKQTEPLGVDKEASLY